ncbi:pentapeptide repeat-containing protein [Brasilonema bromeliae]|uniref:pentapeptide repeat-containing protein n=1 Tax=Brasilonema bromeliae TaxID=383615 RepID=UPI001FE61008|nr:pentapeptide repeat-containing protein [Brasilonema bromeliae]
MLGDKRYGCSGTFETIRIRTDFSNVNLVHVCLTNANLVGAHLIGAHLIRADLRGVDLTAAHLSQANCQTIAYLTAAISPRKS